MKVVIKMAFFPSEPFFAESIVLLLPLFVTYFSPKWTKQVDFQAMLQAQFIYVHEGCITQTYLRVTLLQKLDCTGKGTQRSTNCYAV